MGEKKYLKEIKEFLRRASAEIKIERAILFGSRAWGGATKESDIDLIIVSPDFEGMGFSERVKKMYDFWEVIHPIDFMCYSPSEFEELKKKISVVREAMKRGVVIK